MSTLARSWWIFIAERFPLGSHIPMVFLFSLGNYALTGAIAGQMGSTESYVISFLLCLSFFFRMRCFDEIKDYEVDLKVNPTRPLARGLLSIPQTKAMIAALTVFEIALATFGGWQALIIHVIAMAYSFLMYKEFFIGDILRPHLTTYGLTHTLVSMLLGWSVTAQTSPVSWEHLLPIILWTGPINFALFNLFEFARKTFAPEEERPGVDTYTSLFKPLGALLLNLSQVALALIVLWQLNLPLFESQLILALIPTLAGLWFVWQKSLGAAKLFRLLAGAYLLLFYIALCWQSYRAIPRVDPLATHFVPETPACEDSACLF